MKQLLLPYRKARLALKNHLVMAPMTRSRTIHNIPNDLMALYGAIGSAFGNTLILNGGTKNYSRPMPAIISH
ncbi:hypothetical protein [Chitinophaga japonensis]|uniref:N-ethylmaleimide reductase n=1 Tax=Chitinophaga japonensis TaxID=104662 RepID=A0A562T3H6_CHIJA|nr:hypothetical protein [Chitinophaga japonensis]TWI87868.1 N-ethylmaleimide reductase [Chitinophaga japonensis]